MEQGELLRFLKCLFSKQDLNTTYLQQFLDEEYRLDLEQAKILFDKTKRPPLQQQLSEQPSWRVYYGQRRAELSFAQHYIEILIKKQKSDLWKAYTERYSRDLSITDKERYIDGDSLMLLYEEARLSVKEFHDKFESVEEGLLSLGFALQKVAELKIKEIE